MRKRTLQKSVYGILKICCIIKLLLKYNTDFEYFNILKRKNLHKLKIFKNI